MLPSAHSTHAPSQPQKPSTMSTTTMSIVLVAVLMSWPLIGSVTADEDEDFRRHQRDQRADAFDQMYCGEENCYEGAKCFLFFVFFVCLFSLFGVSLFVLV
jgi:hypothetical protein